MWIAAILSVFAIGISHNASSGLKFASHIYDDIRAGYLIKAVLNKAASDSLNELTKPYNEIDFGDGMRVSYKIADEESKLNINTASKEILERLEGFSPEIASSVIDWRDPDSSSLPGGAEDPYYEGLSPEPYECKDANFEALEELLLVKDMTKELFSSARDTITIFGDGRININTAYKNVLSAIGMSSGLIDSIILFRSGDDRKEGTEDDNIFDNTTTIQTELERVTGPLDSSQSLEVAQLQNLLTVKSNFFKVDITVKAFDKIKANATAIIEYASGKVVYYHQD